MLQDPKRGISASICSHCGEEVAFIHTFCAVCGHKFVYAQLMPSIDEWNNLSIENKENIYQIALSETLADIRKNGDWRIGGINKGSEQLTDLITKPSIKNHVVKQSAVFPLNRPKELELITRAYMKQIQYDRDYDDYEPVFELFRQVFVSSNIEPHPALKGGIREISKELFDYIRRHPDVSIGSIQRFSKKS